VRYGRDDINTYLSPITVDWEMAFGLGRPAAGQAGAASARRDALARSAVDADAVSDSAGEPCGDLLDEPGIAVGIIEGAERPVAGALGVGPGCRASTGNGGPCQISLVSMPRPVSSSWAAAMSETISPPSAEPGAAEVSPWPNVTEAAEPGG
jgi:hypothetical protein